MTGALLSFSATAVAVRGLAATFSVAETLSFRNAAGVAILLALAVARPALRPDLRPKRLDLHLLRNLVHFASTYAWTLGVTLLPRRHRLRARVHGAGLGRAPGGPRPARGDDRARRAIVLGFLGVLVIQRPGLATLQVESFIVLGAALGFAVTAIVTKKLVATESTFAILFFMNLMQLPLTLLVAGEAFWTKVEGAHRCRSPASASAASPPIGA